MQCPVCSTEVPAGSDNSFCEECGSPLSASPAPVGTCACGAPLSEQDDEGFCLRCGRYHRPARPDDHVEESPAPTLAAVSDRGLRHDRNEDRFGLIAGHAASAVVVCDGVSSSRSPQVASSTVVEAVLDSLRAPLASDTLADPQQLLRAALASAGERLTAATNLLTRRTSASRKGNVADASPSSTTVVAALVSAASVTVAWLGDSRAYWLATDGTATQLTRDHSWQNEIVESGALTTAEAAQSPKAHAITRWLGADSGDPEPGLLTHAITAPGTLMLCSDGLWNYAPSPEEIAAIFRSATSSGPLETARALVEFALGRGGVDNITVALVTLDGRTMQANSSTNPGTTEQHGESV